MKRAHLYGIIAILLVAVIAAGAFLYWQIRSPEETSCQASHELAFNANQAGIVVGPRAGMDDRRFVCVRSGVVAVIHIRRTAGTRGADGTRPGIE